MWAPQFIIKYSSPTLPLSSLLPFSSSSKEAPSPPHPRKKTHLPHPPPSPHSPHHIFSPWKYGDLLQKEKIRILNSASRRRAKGKRERSLTGVRSRSCMREWGDEMVEGGGGGGRWIFFLGCVGGHHGWRRRWEERGEKGGLGREKYFIINCKAHVFRIN